MSSNAGSGRAVAAAGFILLVIATAVVVAWAMKGLVQSWLGVVNAAAGLILLYLCLRIMRHEWKRERLAVESLNDVSSQERAQAQLYRTSRFLDSVIQHLPAMLIVKDAQTLAYVRVNKAAEAMIGRAAESLIGLTAEDVLPAEQAGWLAARYRMALETCLPVEVPKLSLRFPDGRWRILKASIVPIIDANGRPIYLLGIFEDNTARLKANADLRRKTREADDANRAKSAFLATMSHEIRTPMNGVAGMIEVLQRTPLAPEQLAMTDTIRESALSLMEIVDDILDFSKIEAGKLELERVPFSLAALMESIADALAPVAQRRGVELLSFSDPSIVARIASDPVRLRQILLNLGDNAVKFSSDLPDRRGRVMLRADVESESDEELQVRFQVVDNGIGMTPEVAAMLFRPFTQAESSTTRRHGGTGLGLSICQRLASLFGGKVQISSVADRGSVFSITFAFAKAGALDPVEWRGALGDLDVLVASPHADTAEVLQRYAGFGGAVVSVICPADCDDRAAAPGGEQEARRLLARVNRRLGAQTVLVLDRPDLPAGGRAAVDAIRRQWEGTGVRLLLLERGRRQRARLLEPGLASLDLDAMRRAAFLRALALVSGRVALDAARSGGHGSSAGAATAIDHPAKTTHLILVAEDNLTNQKVLGYQLGLLGYRAEFAANGREALARWEAGGYSLLLTDCHMPEMDGFELTAAIRLRERDQALRTPIIAVTANALKGEAEHCIRAGMDAYLAKPLGLDRLRQALHQWLPEGPVSVAAAPWEGLSVGEDGTGSRADPDDPAAPAPGPEPVIDPDALGRILGSADAGLLRKFMLDFLENGGSTVQELRAVQATRDAMAVAGVAHRFKSSAAAVGAVALSRTCQTLERVVHSGDWKQMDRLVDQCACQFQAVVDWMHADA
jgi:PAS domain S-box-containing protein